MKFISFFSTILLISLLASHCSIDVPVNAKPKDIWVVYGVLDKLDSVQYLRIMKAFLVDGDAIQYAKDNDISAKGLKVTLTEIKTDGSNGTVYQASEVTVPSAAGSSYPTRTVYKFKTVGSNGLANLKEKQKYEVKITDPNNPELSFTAYTIIPQRPTISDPAPFPNASATERCVPEVSWHKENQVYFKRLYAAPGQTTSDYGAGYGFEFRMFVKYTKLIAGQAITVTDTIFYPMFQQTDPCNNVGDNLLCINFGKKELLSQMKTRMNDPNAIYEIVNEPKCVPIVPSNIIKDIEYEVTSIDTFFTNYLIVTNPANAGFVTNDQTIKYTNLKSTNTKYEVYGIVGSINKGSTYVQLDDCTLYQLRLNNTPQPATSCD
ncbi:MAG: hypothetical protein ACKVTZ_04000 [Bacteroidia bacterium]